MLILKGLFTNMTNTLLKYSSLKKKLCLFLFLFFIEVFSKWIIWFNFIFLNTKSNVLLFCFSYKQIYSLFFRTHRVKNSVLVKGYSYSSNCLNHFTGSKYIIEHNLFTNISLDILNRQTCSSLHLYKCERLCIVFFYFFFNYIILVNVLD